MIKMTNQMSEKISPKFIFYIIYWVSILDIFSVDTLLSFNLIQFLRHDFLLTIISQLLSSPLPLLTTEISKSAKNSITAPKIFKKCALFL